MNKLIGGIALLFLVAGGGSSARADGPWCAFYDASTYNCGFYSFEQCYETVRGAGGSCRPNFFQNFGDGRPAGRRATTGQLTLPDVGSPPRRKARQRRGAPRNRDWPSCGRPSEPFLLDWRRERPASSLHLLSLPPPIVFALLYSRL